MGTTLRSSAALQGDTLEEVRRRGLRALWFEAEPLSGGRGTARRARVGDRICLVKRESRGGLSAKFLPDRYLASAPFEKEWAIAAYLADRRLAPRILAREYARSGPLLAVYSLFEYLPEADSLSDRLLRGQCRGGCFSLAGRGIGLVHRSGVLHADLNAGNILLSGDDSVFLIDFRHSVRMEGAPAPRERRGNLDRLARSLHKVRFLGGLNWDTPPWEALADGYAEGWGDREDWVADWILASGRPPARLRRLGW